MSPRPEERDDVAEAKTLVDRLRGIYTLPVNDGAGLLNGKDTFTRTFEVAPIQHEAADEIERLRSEREQMAARIAELEGAVETVTLQRDLSRDACVRHRDELATLRAALSEYRGDAFYQGITDERMGVERVEGWVHISLEDDGRTRDNLCSCDKAGSWEFHADCGHVGTHTPATLILRHPSPDSEPGPANPADPSPQPHD